VHFSLLKINPPDANPSHGFDDVILPLLYALRRLGYKAGIRFNAPDPASRNVVFGSCIAPRRTGRMLPKGSIVFNLEQIVPDNPWCNRDYMAHLRDFTVWDYSLANVAALRAAGVEAVHVPLGYVPEMTRLRTDCPRPVDALFYGRLTDRRHVAVRRLLAAGVKVLVPEEAFGDARDALLAQSRLVLNIHNVPSARLEVVRLGYVFANRRPVLSERGPGTEVPEHLEEACVWADYEDLPEAAARLLGDGARLEALAAAGFDAFASRPLTRTLAGVLGARCHVVDGGACRPPATWHITEGNAADF
jgi:hypothetical protein